MGENIYFLYITKKDGCVPSSARGRYSSLTQHPLLYGACHEPNTSAIPTLPRILAAVKCALSRGIEAPLIAIEVALTPNFSGAIVWKSCG